MTASRFRLAALLAFGCALATAPSPAADFCPAFPPATGDVVVVSTVAQLRAAVDAAVPGRTILVADGTYALDGEYLRLDVPNVTLRGQSGQRDAVVLDGNYLTTEIVQVAASDVTVADLTLREAYDHPIHVMPAGTSATNRTLVYNVRIVDPGQQAIKINPESDTGPYVDEGTIACSRLELTDAGRAHVRDSCYTGGVDAHAALGWTVRDNVIEGFWCDAGLSEHAIHFWRNARDTRVERNVLRNNARGIGFGLAETGTPRRTYADAPCPAAGGAYVDHYGGTAVNNFVSADDPELFASEYGFDCGICLWQACGASALHNTVHTADVASSFSAIEWRFSRTAATIANNLANFSLRARRRLGDASDERDDRDGRVLRLARHRRPPPPADGRRGDRSGEHVVRLYRRRRRLPPARRRARRRRRRDRCAAGAAVPPARALPRRRHPLGLPRRTGAARGRRLAPLPGFRSVRRASRRDRRLGERHGDPGDRGGKRRRPRQRDAGPDHASGRLCRWQDSRQQRDPGPRRSRPPLGPGRDGLRHRPPHRRRERHLRLRARPAHSAIAPLPRAARGHRLEASP